MQDRDRDGLKGARRRNSPKVIGSDDSSRVPEGEAADVGVGPEEARGEKSLVESMEALIEKNVQGVSGAGDQVKEWEGAELLVDSCASIPLFGESTVRAVHASAPDPEKTYKLADESTIPKRGQKLFRAPVNEGWDGQIITQVIDVDRPLLSAAQIVRSGSRVVLERDGSFTDDQKGNKRIALSQQGGMFPMELWVPRVQGVHFHGPA